MTGITAKRVAEEEVNAILIKRFAHYPSKCDNFRMNVAAPNCVKARKLVRRISVLGLGYEERASAAFGGLG